MYDSEIADVLQKIVNECYKISSTTKMDVFFEYSPPTTQISIWTSLKGSEDGEMYPITSDYNGTRTYCVYFDPEFGGVKPLYDVLHKLYKLGNKLQEQ